MCGAAMGRPKGRKNYFQSERARARTAWLEAKALREAEAPATETGQPRLVAGSAGSQPRRPKPLQIAPADVKAVGRRQRSACRGLRVAGPLQSAASLTDEEMGKDAKALVKGVIKKYARAELLDPRGAAEVLIQAMLREVRAARVAPSEAPQLALTNSGE